MENLILVINKKNIQTLQKKVGVNMDIMQQSACLVLNPKAGPIAAQLDVILSCDYMRAVGPFLCFIIVC